MTKQEMEVLTTRWQRIWSPQGPFIMTRHQDWTCFHAPLGDGIRVEYAVNSEGTSCFLTQGKKHTAFLGFDAPRDSCGEFDLDFFSGNDVDQISELQAQWLPAFRRGCWLSGFDPLDYIDDSEKAEWLQDLTPEEIQAWHL